MIYFKNVRGKFVLTASAYVLLQSCKVMFFIFGNDQVVDESAPAPHMGTDSPLLRRRPFDRWPERSS